MIYSPDALLELVQAGKVVRKLSEREMLNPEGVGFDLRIASLAVVGSGGGSLKTSTRRTPRARLRRGKGKLLSP